MAKLAGFSLNSLYFWVLICCLGSFSGCGVEDVLLNQINKKVFKVNGGYAGFDTAVYPGRSTMQWLWSNTNLYFTGFYLGGSSYLGGRGNPSTWLSKYDELKAMGWGFVPVYVGSQYYSSSLLKTATRGILDAQDAVELASKKAGAVTGTGFPLGSVIYLDLEGGNRFEADMLEYYKAWVQEVIDEGYTPGVYCSYRNTDQLKTEDDRPVFWPVQVNNYSCNSFRTPNVRYPERDPADSGVSYARVWQLVIDCSDINTGGNKPPSFSIDADVSNIRDPSESSTPPSPNPPVIPNLVAPVSPNFPSTVTSVSGNPVTIEWVDQTNASFYKLLFFVWNTMGYWDSYGPFNLMTSSPSYVGGIQNDRYAAWMLQACNTVGCSNWSSPGYFYFIGP